MPLQWEHRETKTVTITLAELTLALRLQQQWQMGKARHTVFPAEGTVKQHMQRCTWQPFLTADNMRDVHQVVINNVCKMIGRQFVSTLVQNLVVKDVTLDADITTNHIIDMNFLTRFHLETDNVLLPIIYQAVNLFLRHGQGITHLKAGVSVILEIFNLLTLRIQLLRSIKSNVCLAGIQQLVNILLIDVTAFTLAIRTVFAAEADTLIKLNSQPFKRVKDVFLSSRNETVRVSILDTEDQFAAMLTGEKVVIQSSTHATNMQSTCRTWGKAHSHISFCHCLKYYFSCKSNVFF